MGFTYALSVTSEAVVSYTALPPLPDCSGGSFLLHFPWSHLHRTLSGILPCEARTFLTCGLSTPAAAIIQPTCCYRLTYFSFAVNLIITLPTFHPKSFAKVLSALSRCFTANFAHNSCIPLISRNMRSIMSAGCTHFYGYGRTAAIR